MKKKLLFLLVPLMALVMTGCVKYNGQGKNGPKSSAPSESQPSDTSDNSGVEPSGSSDSGASQGSGDSGSSQTVDPTPVTGEDLPVGTAVKVYLVFGEYGKYKGNLVNTSVDSLFLEHTMEYSAKVGDDLPGATDVTSTVSGSNFVAWTAYNNDGKLTSYTKVPAVHDKILYASFSGGSGQGDQSGSSESGSGSTSEPSSETVTITFKVTYDAGMGVGIYLVGDFCEWNPGNYNSIKFEWGEGNVWSATKTAPQGMVYRCKLVTAPYDVPSQVYSWEKDGEGNERVITFSSSTTMNLEWGNY